MRYIIHIFILAAISITFSCKKDKDNNSGGSGGSSGASINIKVVDESGFPVSNAEVVSGSVSGTTDTEGDVLLTGVKLDNEKYRLTVNANGFFPGFRNLEKAGSGALHVTIKLIAKQVIGTFNASSSTSVSGSGFTLDLSGSGFQDSDGNSVTGEITAYGRYMSADNMELLSETMPGGDFEAIGETGEEGILESYGFTAFEFEDNAGTRVTPVTGAATVTITVSQAVIDQISAEGANMWVFDEQTLTWSFGGDINVSGSEITMPVSSSTFGNCDKIRASGIVTGYFTCEMVELIGQRVSLRGRTGYAMEYSTFTNDNGRFLVEVGIPSSGGTYTITAGGYQESVEVFANQTTDIDTIDICALAGQDGSPRFNLRWSADADIDLYVRTPGGEVISYSNTQSSDGGQLDVDCTCGDCLSPSENIFWETGPSGTYEYWAEYYGGCGSSPSATFTITVRDNQAEVETRSETINEFESSTVWTYTR